MKIIFFIVILFCNALFLTAQESVNSSGGDAQSSSGSVAFSVGQVVYTTNSSTTGSVAQGVQHAYKIEPNALQDAGSGIQLSLYPNPTQDQIVIDSKANNSLKAYYRLFSSSGILLENKKILSTQHEIDMSALAASTYFLQVLNEQNQIIQTFTITKK